jgi:Membrane protein involved in the export of O-antigen and teichoic acid
MFKLIQLTIFFQSFGYLFQFIAFLLFAKMLGAENQGVLTVFVTTGQIIALLLSFGLPGGIIYFVGKNRSLFLPVVANCCKLVLALLPVLVLVLYILPIDKLSPAYLIRDYIPYLLISIFFLTFLGIFQVSILSLKKYLYYNLFAFGTGFIIFILCVFIWFAPVIYNKLNLSIIAYLVTYGTVFIYGATLVIKESMLIRNKGGVQSFWEQFKVGSRGFISSIAALLLFRLDIFLVAYFLSLREVGIYSIALFSAEMVTKIPGWSAAILTPMVASNEGGHIKRTVYLFYSSIIVAFLLGLLFLLGILNFSNVISNLIGKDFTGVETCLLLLLPRVIMQSGVGILAANLAGKGYPWYHPAGCTFPLIILVFLDFILIPRFGINGAALGNSLAFVSAFIIFWIGFRKYNELTEDVSFKTYIVMLFRHLPGNLLRF